jgi:hypothetical protein
MVPPALAMAPALAIAPVLAIAPALAMATALVVAAPTMAAAASAGASAVDAVRACRAERDDARRLACFDAASARLGEPGTPLAGAAAGGSGSASAAPSTAGAASAAAGASSAAGGATGTAAAVAQMTPEERFGFRGEVARETLDRQRAELPELERLTTTVTATGRQAGGDFVVTLANGQVWAQLPTGTPQRLKVGDEITISPAALGSYILKMPNGRGVRVRRVR